MIPVRLPATFTPHIVSDGKTLAPDHPLRQTLCPVCDGALGVDVAGDGGLIALVAVGIHPEDRKDGGWTTGAAVAAHAMCVGPGENREATPQELTGRQILDTPMEPTTPERPRSGNT